jgi:hypothetical protein
MPVEEESFPRREVVSRCLCGRGYVYLDTMHFDRFTFLFLTMYDVGSRLEGAMSAHI